jgi:hypothetical protein
MLVHAATGVDACTAVVGKLEGYPPGRLTIGCEKISCRLRRKTGSHWVNYQVLPPESVASDRAPDAAEASPESASRARVGACAERSTGTPAGVSPSVTQGADAAESRVRSMLNRLTKSLRITTRVRVNSSSMRLSIPGCTAVASWIIGSHICAPSGKLRSAALVCHSRLCHNPSRRRCHSRSGACLWQIRLLIEGDSLAPKSLAPETEIAGGMHHGFTRRRRVRTVAAISQGRGPRTIGAVP